VCVTRGEVKKHCRMMGVAIWPWKEGVCVTHSPKKKFVGCTKQAQREGVCYRHSTKSISIHINNNPSAGVAPAILSCQSIND
jgi:hypothetical protein